jgi:hypothetical protein
MKQTSEPANVAPTTSLRNVAWIIYLGVALALPVLLCGFPFPTHDGEIHEIWCSHFSAQLWAGDVYPRWLQHMNEGLGSPTFYFYPSLPYFITSLLDPLFGTPRLKWGLLGVSAALALVLSGVFTYMWLNQFLAKRSSMFGAVLYMAMPYHFAIDLHTRGAFAEFWAFVWMPLVLFFTHQTIKSGKLISVGLAMSYACLVMTHLPTTLMFSLIPLAYSIWLSPRGTWLANVVHIGLGMALGVGLAAVYLLPAMLEQDAVSLHHMRSGHGYFENGFFFPHPSWNNLRLARDDFEHELFWTVANVVGVAFGAWLIARRNVDEIPSRQTRFWFVTTLLATFMMFPLSKMCYLMFSSLQMIQFPWRFNTIVTLATTALVALGLESIRKPYSNRLVFGLVVVGVLMSNWIPQTVRSVIASSFSQNPNWDGALSSKQLQSRDTAEYRPRWATNDFEVVLKKFHNQTESLTTAIVANGQGEFEVQAWRPRFISLYVNAKSQMSLEIRQLYYPGWTATINNTPLAVLPSETDGLLNVFVPSGRHNLELRLAKSKYEWVGTAVSIGTALLLLTVIVFRLIKPQLRNQQ